MTDTPEILPPEHRPAIRPKFSLAKLPMLVARLPRPWRVGITGFSVAGVFGYLLWAFNEFTSLRGWINVLTSRIVLASMWLAGTLLVLIIVLGLQIRKWLPITISVSVLILFAMVGLDRIAPTPMTPTSAATGIPPRQKDVEKEMQPEPLVTVDNVKASVTRAANPNTKSRALSVSPTASNRHRSQHTPSTIPLPPAPSAVEEARIGALSVQLNTNDGEHKVYVPVILKNFGTRASQGKLEPSVFVENPVTHESVDRPASDPPQMLSFGPQQENTYTFNIGGDEALYNKIIHEEFTTKATLRFTYRPNLSIEKTVTYKLVTKLNFKAHQAEIIFSGWE